MSGSRDKGNRNIKLHGPNTSFHSYILEDLKELFMWYLFVFTILEMKVEKTIYSF